jgi:hypothetical protein
VCWTDKILSLVLLVLASTSGEAASFYLDCEAGRDSNDGRSPSSAWRTIGRANLQIYGPGDTISLKRNCLWAGVGFKARGNGNPEAPIILTDYGDAGLPLPVIDGVGVHEPAILLQNVQNWTVSNLELTQHGQTPQNLDANNEKGKDADQYSDEYMRAVVHVLGLGTPGNVNCGEPCTVRNIRLENLIVHDGSWNGIFVSGGYYQLRTGTHGAVDNIVISGVESYNNHKAGIEVTCTYFETPIYATSNVWVLNSYLHHNGGDGAMVGPVRNALLDGNVCSYNGRIRNARVGCWTWDSENTIIQFNESHHNMTPLNNHIARDGSGFDLDLGSRNGLLQFNWSHDNQGEGFLLLTWPIGFGYSRGISENIQMRYNVSERDGKKLAGGITIFGGVLSAVIHNNVVYYEPDRLAGTDMFNGEGGPLTTSIWGRSGKPDLRVYNNIFITDGRKNPRAVSNNLWSDAAGTFTFNNNVWWRVEGGVRFQWAGSAINTWSGWQSTGFDANSINADPRVIGPLGGGPGAYILTQGSLAINRGRNVTDGWAGMGNRDAFGVPIPQSTAFDIGASEFRTLSPNPAARLLTVRRQSDGAWQVRFTGAPGRTYLVQTSSDFLAWNHAGRASEISTGLFEFLDRTRRGLRFYRAVTQ